jgi:hypothetical protein
MAAIAHTTFETIYDIPELGTLIMDSAALSALVALSFVNTAYFFRVHEYIRNKLHRILGPFGIQTDDIMEILQSTNAVVVGTIALQAVAPISLALTTRNIDIVVDRYLLPLMESWLVDFGYQLKDSINVPTDYLVPYRNRRSFTRMFGTREMFVNLLLVEHSNQAHEFVFFATNTTFMNSITRNGLFNGYSSLLSQRLAVENHVHHMQGVRQFFDSNDVDLVTTTEDDKVKAEGRGFRFLLTNSVSHWPTTCRCIPRSACPLEPRHMNDFMSTSMSIFTDDETQHIRARAPFGGIPISIRHPVVIWKLAGTDCEGYSERKDVMLWR